MERYISCVSCVKTEKQTSCIYIYSLYEYIHPIKMPIVNSVKGCYELSERFNIVKISLLDPISGTYVKKNFEHNLNKIMSLN